MNTTPDFAALSTPALAAAYNVYAAITGAKPVARFSDKPTAIKRTTAIHAEAAALKPAPKVKPAAKRTDLAAYVQGTCPACGDSANGITCGRIVERGGRQVEVDEHRAMCHVCGHEFHYDTGRALKPRAETGGNAAGVAASWTRPEVAAARAARHAVKVAGCGQFKSVAAAFAALNLPAKLIISTRMALVAGEKVELDGHKFTLA